MEMIKLKNGAVENDSIVKVVALSRQTLWESGIPGICAVCDLVEICKGGSYPTDQATIQKLRGLALLESDEYPHDSVRNIVLSSVVGERFDMSLTSPIAAASPPAARKNAPKP